MTSPTPTSRLERRRLVDSAWQGFVEGGLAPTGLPGEIERSWRRARDQYQIDPGLRRPARRLGAEALRQRCDADEVLRLARPILTDFAGRLGLEEHVLTYFDGDGWMLAIDGQAAVIEAVSEIDFRPGACWAEDAAGTNGPGTALAEGRPVEVFASEHFVAAWQRWSCAAAPILAPGQAAPVGLVDITGPWEFQRRQALMTAKAIARAVEERLRAALSVREEVVRHAFRAAHASGDALVAVDGRATVVAVNDAAARRRVVDAGQLPPRVREALRRVFTAPASGRTAEVHLELPDAPGLVISPVLHDGAVVGAIVRGPPVRPPARRGAGRAQAEPPAPRSAAPARYDFGRILGESPALRRAVDLARIAAGNALPVTLFGESGTGKELFAQAIHGAGGRRDGPFVPVNCGSIPDQLAEAELFGYQAGTFTGGRRDGNPGRFEDADGGTLFLDEVTELSGPAQTALLRVLQEKEVVRLGGSAARRVDVRIIAASNRPLLDEVRGRRFRRDLYYRLHVLSIDVPPLRARAGDVALLARGFLAEAEVEVGRPDLSFAEAALAALRAYPWPGNVRELRNVVLRAAATAPRAELQAGDLLFPDAEPGEPAGAPAAGAAATLRLAVGEREREALEDALAACGWNCSRAAGRLGVSRMTLYRLLARHGLSRPAAR